MCCALGLTGLVSLTRKLPDDTRARNDLPGPALPTGAGRNGAMWRHPGLRLVWTRPSDYGKWATQQTEDVQSVSAAGELREEISEREVRSVAETVPNQNERGLNMERERKTKKARRGRGEASIFQRESDGLWVGTVSLGYDGEGKRIRRTVYGATKGDAQTKLDELRTEARAGNLPEAGSLTVGQLLER